MTILIADDVIMMRGILKDMLVRYCDVKLIDIYEAGNGAEAVEKYKALKPMLVLLDISMPTMNGIDAVREIMKFDPTANIIMIAASSDENSVRQCIDAGAMDYIIKPPSPERVMKAIREALSRMVKSLPHPDDHRDSIFASSSSHENLADRVEHLESEVESLKAEMALLWKVIGVPV